MATSPPPTDQLPELPRPIPPTPRVGWTDHDALLASMNHNGLCVISSQDELGLLAVTFKPANFQIKQQMSVRLALVINANRDYELYPFDRAKNKNGDGNYTARFFDKVFAEE